ncbi:Protein NLRC5 [Holothuria leucospilota]|uniref:Protein NLRC5 n=1 Tax=Holothuria leucospilota TaxID=206669 RepID=A0A9Q1CR78_HOLLE|nr:Protein NLRC5 [Holothuria leucospilota]
MECASYGQSAQSKETSEGSTVKQNMPNRPTNNTLGELKIAVARELSSIDCQMVATMAGFRSAEKERMKDGISLMDALESKGYFEESEMETLVDLFTKCELHKVAGIIEAYIKVTDKDEKQRKVSDTYRPCAQDLLVRDAAKAPNESKEKIFVSFSFSIKERVMTLKDRIETYLGEDTCWICTTGVDGGDNLDTEIVRAIDNADIILCMINEGFVQLSRSKNKHLIPILLENVEWPLKKSSGEPSPMQLAFTQLLYVNLHDQTMKEDEFKKLITTIKKRLGLMEEGTLTPRFSTQTQTPHPPPAKSLSPVVKENKTQLVKELRNKYKNLFGKFQPSPLLRDNYDIDKLFVENGIKFLKETHGASDEHERWRMLKDYKTIFTDPQIKSKRFILDGEPGYGKSALTLQITHDWCQQLKPLDQFQVLILLRLRQFSKVPTIYSAIRKFLLPRDSKLTEDDIKNILDGSSTIVILDGYDEYPDRGQEDTDIEHIIRGDMFQEHVVFLTSRTSCLPSNYSSETKRLRLTGFDATARDNYIQNMVTVGRPQGACKIHQFLKVNTVPADFCKIPLFFAMICYMVLKEERFYNLNTVTEFFEHIIICFYSHDQIKEVGAETKLEYCTLGKIALEGLSSDSQKLSWEDNDLKVYIGQNLYKQYIRIGILNEEENYDYDSKKYKTEVTFYHKLFAEWFAAHYLAEKAEKHLTKLTKVWRYVRQPTRRRSLHNLMESLNPDDVQFLYRFACGLSP